jgi:PAS domain S-box-containing protein
MTGGRYGLSREVTPLPERRPTQEGGGASAGPVGALQAIAEGLCAEQRDASRVLQETLRLFATVLEGTRDAVFVKDPEGRYLMINSAGAAMLGRRVEEVVGQRDEALFAPETAARMMQRDRAILASGQTWTYESLGESTGTVRHYLSTKGVLHDGERRVVGLFGISRDITEHRQVERERAELRSDSRERLAELTLLHSLAMEAATLDCTSLLERGLHHLSGTLGCEDGAAYLLEGDTLERRAQRGMGFPTQMPSSRLGMDLFDLAPEGRVPVGEERAEVLVGLAGRGMRAMVVPLLGTTRAVGALCLMRSDTRPFLEREMRLLGAVGAQLGVAVENAQLLSELRRSHSALARMQAKQETLQHLVAQGQAVAELAPQLKARLEGMRELLGLLRQRTAPLSGSLDVVQALEQDVDQLEQLLGQLA